MPPPIPPPMPPPDPYLGTLKAFSPAPERPPGAPGLLYPAPKFDLKLLPKRGGLLPPYDPLLPLESRPLLPGLAGIPGRFFIPPIACLFDTDGNLKSSAPREPIPPGPRLFIPLPDDPILPWAP